jgi:hypothetical protein
MGAGMALSECRAGIRSIYRELAKIALLSGLG